MKTKSATLILAVISMSFSSFLLANESVDKEEYYYKADCIKALYEDTLGTSQKELEGIVKRSSDKRFSKMMDRNFFLDFIADSMIRQNSFARLSSLCAIKKSDIK